MGARFVNVGLGWACAVALVLGAAAPAQAGSIEERAAALVGDWNGEYVCNQGLTGMTLAVRSAHPAGGGKIAMRARYIFFAIAENPNLPTGCYELAGHVDAATGALTLEAGRWLRHPDGWLTVDLSGAVDFAALSMSGAVEGYNCTTFTLAKAATPTKSEDECFTAPLYSFRDGAGETASGASAEASVAP